MKDILITLACCLALLVAAFYAGQRYEKSTTAEAAAKAVAREAKTQGQNDAKANSLGDAARCAVLGGRLQPDGECR